MHTGNDAKDRPQLYRLNQLSAAELKIYLTLILTTETEMNSTRIPELPTEDEMKLAFFGSDSNADGATNTIDTTSNNQELESESISPEEAEVAVNEPCIVIWDTGNGRKWYLGICISEEIDGSYTVEHLERCFGSESKIWRHPSRPDIQPVDSLQILPCNIMGFWEYRKRIMTFGKLGDY